ncbi:MAG: hypothetical protein FWB96_03935 [Defluviitaleaceae bacterium]|nr:hypothetical protein [Defluviitaleaceae bacterium]MCL2262063.1 hypothetical protein [Defluviitaleaceae bacterium]
MACGHWYGVYNMRDGEACVGVFESTAEICAFFGGIKAHRVSKSVMLDYWLTFGSERYKVICFREPTRKEVKGLLRQRFGDKCYKISKDGIYFRIEGKRGWQLFAQDLEEAAMLLNSPYI